jgi:dimethylargininase
MSAKPQAIAITRAISPSIAACELTHINRVPIDVERARAQHRAYEEALIEAGYLLERLDSSPQMPDSVFVEDMAIVFDELAIVTRPGAESRRQETPAVADALAAYLPLQVIAPPATVDGGDVLVAGRTVVVGRSTRTNEAAVVQMRQLLEPLGYQVVDTVVRGCLHLKSAVTALGDDVLLVNRNWIDKAVLAGFTIVDVDRSEPSAANALRLHDRVIFSSSYPRTAERIARAGYTLSLVDASELAKAEGAVTCCSLIVDPMLAANREVL